MKNIKKILILVLVIISTSLFAFQVNEKLVFDIKYGIIGAGEATLEVSETTYQDSIDCFRITSRAKTNSFFDRIFKVRDQIESIWNKQDLVAIRYTKKLREGNYRQQRIHFYYPDLNMSIYAKYSRKTGKFKQKKMEIPDNTQDILSAFYWYRLQELEVGSIITINVTADGRNYPADIIVHRKETIETIFGKKECFVVEPILEDEAIFKQTGQILIWLTADQYKIPVKMSSEIIFGSFKAILKDAKNVPYQKK